MTFEFDEIISAPCRLGILATLMPGDPISFTEMKAITSLSDGNLHVQTRKLADVGYINIRKAKQGKRSVTQFSITELGREKLREHVSRLQRILDAEAHKKVKVTRKQPRTMLKSTKQPEKRAARPDDSAVWA